MTDVWFRAALWLGLALLATMLSIWLHVATALSEIAVGTTAHFIIGALVGTAFLGADEGSITLLSGNVTQAQDSQLVATDIASAVVPMLIVIAFFLPHHLLPTRSADMPAQSADKPETEPAGIAVTSAGPA
jgi:hypothetical protein